MLLSLNTPGLQGQFWPKIMDHTCHGRQVCTPSSGCQTAWERGCMADPGRNITPKYTGAPQVPEVRQLGRGGAWQILEETSLLNAQDFLQE